MIKVFGHTVSLIDDWRKAWKFGSMWLVPGAGFLFFYVTANWADISVKIRQHTDFFSDTDLRLIGSFLIMVTPVLVRIFKWKRADPQ